MANSILFILVIFFLLSKCTIARACKVACHIRLFHSSRERLSDRCNTLQGHEYTSYLNANLERCNTFDTFIAIKQQTLSVSASVAPWGRVLDFSRLPYSIQTTGENARKLKTHTSCPYLLTTKAYHLPTHTHTHMLITVEEETLQRKDTDT